MSMQEHGQGTAPGCSFAVGKSIASRATLYSGVPLNDLRYSAQPVKGSGAVCGSCRAGAGAQEKLRGTCAPVAGRKTERRPAAPVGCIWAAACA